MLVATWVLAAATCGLLVTSFTAVLVWREAKRRERREQERKQEVADLDKRFLSKEQLSKAGWLAAVGAVALAITWAAAKDKYTDQ